VSIGSFALITRCPPRVRLAAISNMVTSHFVTQNTPPECALQWKEEVRRDPQLVFLRKSIEANVVRIRNSSFCVIGFVA
jgi:hypothetical protein